MSDNDSAEVRLTIRIPDDLRREVVRLSRRDTRSVNGEVIHLLRRAVAAESDKAP